MRLRLQRPDETVEVLPPRSGQSVTVLCDAIRDLLNGVEPKAPALNEAAVADESPAADVEAALPGETAADDDPEPTTDEVPA